MRIALIYPPPWKLPDSGQAPDPKDGPPEGLGDDAIDADFHQLPYGLLSIAALLEKSGHQTKVLNLSSRPWTEVERVAQALEADVYGMSCYTANRRGVGLTAELLRRRHPKAFIIVGGPHATALPLEMLVHHPAIDAVAFGEGEHTMLELLGRLEQDSSLQGVAGLAHRVQGKVVLEPVRARIASLDTLAPVHEHFSTHLLMTSRGCPGSCSYCAKNVVWGREWRAHSAEWVLRSLEHAAARLPVKMVMLKDDTFTADRRRALEICRGMRERRIALLWSCDTRADALNEELVREMRLAGCQRVSLGVESGSPKILKNIGKNLTLDKVVRATKLAQAVGLQVRWFMMLGNRGETAGTMRESLEFLRKGEPDQFIFACLSVYPGTRDFQSLEKAGALDREVYFQESFLELKTPFDASEQDTALMSDWFERNKGLRTVREPDVQQCAQVLERLGEHHAAHLDLAAAMVRAGQWDDAEKHARASLELGLPTPGLAYSLLGCVCAARGELGEMKQWFERGQQEDPWHAGLQHNRRWVERCEVRGDGPQAVARGLVASHEFQILERTVQPTLPGPLETGWDTW